MYIFLDFTLSLPTTSTWTLISNWWGKLIIPATVTALTWQIKVPFVALKIISVIKVWVWNPNWTPFPEGVASAKAVLSNNSTKRLSVKLFKLNCQVKFAKFPSWSLLLLKWSTPGCTGWVGGRLYEIKLAPSEKSKASASHQGNDFVSWRKRIKLITVDVKNSFTSYSSGSEKIITSPQISACHQTFVWWIWGFDWQIFVALLRAFFMTFTLPANDC